MPYLPTAQSWLQNSTLLLSARPTTTRITTKYTILRPRTSDSKASRPQSQSKSITTTSAPAPAAGSSPASHHQPTKAVLVLKTYDPVSGTCLKYRTDKAADVGRLIAALGTCGRVMAALPEKEKEVEKEEEGGEGVGAGEAKRKPDRSEVLGRGGEKEKEGKGKASIGAGGGGGGGKKKKGKR